MPFVGIIHNFIDDDVNLDRQLGKSLGYIHYESAKTVVPKTKQVPFFKIATQVLPKIMLWKIKGLNKHSAFFTDDGKTDVKATVLKLQSE
jgi:hypothetical protein